MPAYVILDVDVKDVTRYQDFMAGVKPMMEAAGARYLARGGVHQVHEGDWQPRRLVVMEFPSIEAWDAFYTSPAYAELRHLREESSSARLVAVEGIET
jgi:uncharacterized protein (DUF1330 family)